MKKTRFYLDNLIHSIQQVSTKSTHRLPKSIIPSHYRLFIDVSQLEEFIFYGTVDIDIQVEYSEIFIIKEYFEKYFRLMIL